MNYPDNVLIVDVSPRDGLQNEKQTVPAAVKFQLIEDLIAAGVKKLEATSFVSPKWVPQMGDNNELMSLINAPNARHQDVCYSVLVPNMRGFENALPYHPDEVVIFASASETFSQKNINCSIDESIERFAPVAIAAKENGIKVRGVISCTVGCPYEGDIAPSQVAYVTKRLVDIGADHIGVADTIGVGTPVKVQNAMKAAMQYIDVGDISGHFHDTYGQALANIQASLALGVAQYDTSAAGLGGCPYAKGATGNVATEDVLFMLHGMGIKTGINIDKLAQAGYRISDYLNRRNGSRVATALKLKQEASV